MTKQLEIMLEALSIYGISNINKINELKTLNFLDIYNLRQQIKNRKDVPSNYPKIIYVEELENESNDFR